MPDKRDNVSWSELWSCLIVLEHLSTYAFLVDLRAANRGALGAWSKIGQSNGLQGRRCKNVKNFFCQSGVLFNGEECAVIGDTSQGKWICNAELTVQPKPTFPTRPVGRLSMPPRASPASLCDRSSSQQWTSLTSQKKSRCERREGAPMAVDAETRMAIPARKIVLLKNMA